MGSSRWDLARSEAKLAELASVVLGAKRQGILILTHNNPDPDTIAGSLALQFLLKKRFGVASRLGYGGMITRSENKAMVQRLRIPMTQLSRLNPAEYFGIALVDAQPATGNNLVTSRSEPPLIVVDHHPLRRSSLKAVFRDIRPKFGATSTILTEYLVASEIKPSRSVANALLYGIKSDTNSLIRDSSEADFRAFSYLAPLTNPRVLGWIEKPALPAQFFDAYHQGLSRTTLYRDVAVCNAGKVELESIIPVLADDLIRIDGVSWSLVMGRQKHVLVMSLRSTSRTMQAGHILRRLVGSSGSAGGHITMAGGQIPLTGKDSADDREFCEKLVMRFLELINRNACHGRSLVGEQDCTE